MLDLQWDFDEAKVAWFKQGEKKGNEKQLLENLSSVMESFNVSVCRESYGCFENPQR